MNTHAAREPVTSARQVLADVLGKQLSDQALAAQCSELARLLLVLAEAEKRPDERARAALLSRLMDDPTGQAFTTLLTDRVVRSQEPSRTVDAARQLLRRLGIPDYLPTFARLQMRGLLHAGPFVPALAARAMLARLRRESRHVVLSAESTKLTAYLRERREQGVRINANLLGEAVLGEGMAAARLDAYVALLSRPDVESISVKVSSIFSQIDLLAWDASLACLTERLQVIYRAALAHTYERPDGSRVPKLVNLDMESYRDVAITLAAFRRALDAPELLALTAGIVLQAYLPDSLPLQSELTTWAQARVHHGGAPIRLRVVKGANLLTERADSALRGLVVPIYPSKAEVDASFKAMVEFGCRPAHAQAVHLGIASHNLFDIAFGMVQRAMHGTEQAVSFELLEGMADHVCRAVTAIEQAAGSALLYAPLCEEASMQTAIAYLVRRLDENTAEQNFLRHSFAMQPGDQAWQDQQKQFVDALQNRHSLGHDPRRGHDRHKPTRTAATDEFANEPDTDFSLAHCRASIGEILDRYNTSVCMDVPLQVGGEERFTEPCGDGFDPSRPGARPYRFALATDADIERALGTAVAAAERWGASPLEQRVERLLDVAQALREQRGELIAAMLLDAGKRVDQADAEVSEAIDFAEYYARNMLMWRASVPEVRLDKRGVVLVTPPWNFPLAIPLGGVLAALVAGNSVILKPALETVLVGERLARLCWSVGIPKDALQLVICSDERGSQMIRDPRVAQVVLTGGTQTAHLFAQLRPGRALMAETGGKNSLIVSAMSDRDEAIKDALASAFGHAGQKCSACSLLVLEAEVYDDPEFLATLRDAAASLHVGSSWDLRSVITPLINPPQGALLRGLTTLEDGEQWLLEPKRDLRNLRLWSPGIKLGVREGSFTHTTEFFGPLLAVLRADDLDHAVRIANATPYGLTAGLHSLDEGEQKRWTERIVAGNLYINRPITGAIVRRQPFGGHKASSFGPGAKAGGPNYLLQMTQASQCTAPRVVCAPRPEAAEPIVAARRHLTEAEREKLSVAACSYADAHRHHFAVDHDPSLILGERNVFRYQPARAMLLRAAMDATPTDVLMACVAAITAGVVFELSLEPSVAEAMPYVQHLPHVKVLIEDATLCAERLPLHTTHLRALGTLEPEMRAAAETVHIHVSDEPVMQSGRIELLRYHREQSISHRHHRYGNLAGEQLLMPLRSAGT